MLYYIKSTAEIPVAVLKTVAVSHCASVS